MTPVTQTTTLAIFDYVLAHAKNDLRPYLNIHVYGQTFLAVLDSGYTRTIMENPDYKMFESTCLLNKTNDSAENFERLFSHGWVYVP